MPHSNRPSITRLFIASSIFVVMPIAVFAQSGGAGLEAGLRSAAGGAGLSNICSGTPEACIAQIAGNVINILLGLSGLVLLGYLLYAGFLWMTAQGDEDKTKQAMATIRNAIIGLVIITAAFAASIFIVGQLSTIGQTAPTGTVPDAEPPPRPPPPDGG